MDTDERIPRATKARKKTTEISTFIKSIPTTPMTLSIAIIITHFLCDWILQPRRMAENKSTNALWLWAHLAINTLGFAALLLVFQKFAFVPLYINLVSHALIDWNIWRGYKWIALRRIRREAEKTIQEHQGMINSIQGKLDPFGLTYHPHKDTQLEPLGQFSVESIIQNWKDRNLYAEDYSFYATIALDQCLHLVIALWLFA